VRMVWRVLLLLALPASLRLIARGLLVYMHTCTHIHSFAPIHTPSRIHLNLLTHTHTHTCVQLECQKDRTRTRHVCRECLVVCCHVATVFCLVLPCLRVSCGVLPCLPMCSDYRVNTLCVGCTECTRVCTRVFVNLLHPSFCMRVTYRQNLGALRYGWCYTVPHATHFAATAA